MTTFGQTISDARKQLKISQKDFASRIKKEDGTYISAQYLNDIEHDRRNPPSEMMIKQIAKELRLSADYLLVIAGTVPKDIQEIGKRNPEMANEVFSAFRRGKK